MTHSQSVDLIFSVDTIPSPVSTNAIGVASLTTASSSATTTETISSPTPTPIPTPTPTITTTVTIIEMPHSSDAQTLMSIRPKITREPQTTYALTTTASSGSPLTIELTSDIESTTTEATINGSQPVTETAQTSDIYTTFASDSIITQNSITITTPKLENETMPNSTDSKGIITKTDPSLSKIAEKSSQAVTIQETAAWVLLSLASLTTVSSSATTTETISSPTPTPTPTITTTVTIIEMPHSSDAQTLMSIRPKITREPQTTYALTTTASSGSPLTIELTSDIESTTTEATINGSQPVTETAQTSDIYTTFASDSIITQNSITITTPKLENETMPNSTDSKGIITKTDPSLSKIADKSSQAVTMRETAAWVLLSLVTLLFIGLLSVDIAVLCIYKYRQTQNNTAEAISYEMAGNPCYESTKIGNTNETNIYEPIETDNAYSNM